MSDTISRRHYLYWGVGLTALSLVGELGLGLVITDPDLLFNPVTRVLTDDRGSLDLLYHLLDWGGLSWSFLLLLFWGIPFMWVGATMSVRRAADAGISPWWGLLFLVPYVRVALMLLLCFLPSSPNPQWHHPAPSGTLPLSVLFRLLMVLTFVGVLLVVTSVLILKTYGLLLFVAIPFMMGLLVGLYANQHAKIGVWVTLWLGFVLMAMIHLVLWMVAFEGLLCLSMSFPLCVVLGGIGSLLGRVMARTTHRHHMGAIVMGVAYPFLALSDAHVLTHRDVVMSQVTIAASPAQVWPHVVQFPDLPPPQEWPFKSGIAYPLRARIVGEGVGAIRYCEFSTGPFVEPITVWDQPRRLAFNVTQQPAPMTEWSLYQHVTPPHLDGYFRSVRGEFRLVPLPNGSTRLEGRTWIELDIHPGWYWQWYARWLIHRIHMQVLTHIKHTTEQGVSDPA